MRPKLRLMTAIVMVLALILGGSPAQAGIRVSRHHVLTAGDPAMNAVIPQNDPSSGCPFSATSGYGFKINFQWTLNTPLNGHSYQLVVQHTGAAFPALVYPDPTDPTAPPLTDPNYQWGSCGFVIDSNLSNWYWQVTILKADGSPTKVSSPPQPFSFAPCRLSGGAACNAPAP